MTKEEKSSIESLLNSNNPDDNKLGIIILWKEYKNLGLSQRTINCLNFIRDLTMNYRCNCWSYNSREDTEKAVKLRRIFKEIRREYGRN